MLRCPSTRAGLDTEQLLPAGPAMGTVAQAVCAAHSSMREACTHTCPHLEGGSLTREPIWGCRSLAVPQWHRT